MPRYLVERSFPQGLDVPLNADGRKALDELIANNADLGVTWVHSYVTPDRTRTFCIYDAPSPESVRKAADRCGLPLGGLTQVNVLDPYFYGA